MTHRGYTLVFAGLSAVSGLWADESVVFRSDVALVRVEAQVVDRDNRTITGLGPSDFVLREGGKQQRIQGVDSENLPIDLLLLLDVSASMRPHVERIANASHEAMRQLNDNDRVGIMVFDRYTRVRMAFRSGRSDVDREMQRLLDQESFRGGTDITRGLLDATSYIERNGRRDARKAIVIVTDDQTERNRDVEGVSRALTRADTILSALIAPDAMQYRDMRRGGGGYPGGGYPGGGLGGIILGRRGGYPGGGYPGGGYPGGRQIGGGTRSAATEEIALRSGGDTFPVHDAYSLENTLARIRQRYAIHFYVPDGVRAGDERSIEVELSDTARARHPGAEVRYRRSYYAPAGGGSSPARNTDAPVVVSSRAGDASSAPADDSDRPRIRRRAGVSQVPDQPHDGPVLRDNPPASSTASSAAAPPSPESDSSRDGWRRADPGTTAPASTPDTGGWRKARPEELPHP